MRPIVRSHHERFDGTGYPDGLRGDAIPLLAQILGIVEVFDALATRRPYKEAISTDHALDELAREVERGWRRWDLVEAFIALGDEGRRPSPGVPRNSAMASPFPTATVWSRDGSR